MVINFNPSAGPRFPSALAGSSSKRAEPPHERQLKDVAVAEQERGSARPLRASDRLHVAGAVVGGQEHIFQRAELDE